MINSLCCGLSLHTAIHPFSSGYPEPGHGIRLSKTTQTFFTQGNALQLLLETPRRSHAREDIKSLQLVLGLPQGLLAVWICLEYLQWEASRRLLNQMPSLPHLPPFGCKEGSGSIPSSPTDVRAAHPVSKAEARHPADGTHFGSLYPWSHFCSHYPKLETTGEGWSGDWLVNWEISLLAQCFVPHNSLG